jgi:2-amino-4-hydroxy-6-hydroxymethyldihydropteridine diphosphokinase
MIILGIGSNLSSRFGDRIKNIDLSIDHLKRNNIKIIKKSNYYETPSYPDKKKPKFINVVVSFDSDLSASKLASIIINVEGILERKRLNKNDPRTCDIDIIDFNGKILNFKYNNLYFNVPHLKLSI